MRDLRALLNGHDHAQTEAIAKLRSRIGSVTVYLAEGVEVEATGRISNILVLATGQSLGIYVNGGAGTDASDGILARDVISVRN